MASADSSAGYVFCNQCGHRNPPLSNFCSACGAPLDFITDRTITLTKVDPLQDAPGPEDDVTLSLADLPAGSGVLVVRSGAQMGEQFLLKDEVTHLGRHLDNEISLDDITVSRRHAEIVTVPGGHVVRDVGSLNGTYVNQRRIDEARLQHGDELQVGKFRLVYLDGPPA
jgi:pSer/pThr/pTyr-binding forkhead associated (FHA) protein